MILFFTFCGFCVSQENPLTSFCYSTNILFLASEAPLLSLVQQHLPLLTFSYCEVPSFFIALFCCMVANTLSLHMCLSQVWTLAVAHSRQSQLTKSLRKLVFHPVKEVLCQGKVVKAWLNSDNKMRNVTVQWIKLCILFCCVTWWKVMVWVFVYLKKNSWNFSYLWKYLHQSQVLFCSCCFLGLRLNWHLSEPQISVYSCSQ